MTHNTLTQNQYLTVPEVAKDLRLSPMTVYRLINRGTITAIRIGTRTFRIPAGPYQEYKRRLHAESQQRAAAAHAIPGQMAIPA